MRLYALFRPETSDFQFSLRFCLVALHSNLLDSESRLEVRWFRGKLTPSQIPSLTQSQAVPSSSWGIEIEIQGIFEMFDALEAQTPR